MNKNTKNPFIESYKAKTFKTPDETIPFGVIKSDHYLPALDFAIQLAKENILKIKQNKSEANFENTIEALEVSSELLEQISSVYFTLYSAEATEELQALAKEISPKLASYSSDVNLDLELFNKVKFVYDTKEKLKLDNEQLMLVENFYKSFCRNGALLSAENKTKLRKIDQELSTLSPQFSENVLKATNNFKLIIKDPADLKGLPQSSIETAAHEAEELEYTGNWVFTLHAPSFLPFMQYADKRALREKIWKAYNAKAFKDDFDNQDIILQIVKLKSDRAKLLGFNTHAEFVLKERMAESEKNVLKFLDQLLTPAKKAAENDLLELKQFKNENFPDQANQDLMPWDIAYYSEKLKEKKYHFNEEALRPYFKLENVVEGIFLHAKKLYELEFILDSTVPVYHPDVKTYKVIDLATKEFVGYFYTDFFPRATKKSGAWMTTLRDQGFFNGEVKRPHVCIVCNFTKPTATKPSLITYDEVHTLFHEFGHALHALLSKCKYRSLSGANVYWDFVELPSQIMENWVKEKESLDLFAKHFETNEQIPKELVQKLNNAHKFQNGWFCLRQLQLAYLDIAWHTNPVDLINSVEEFERSATDKTRLLPKVEGANTSCSFSHIFAGGYSAGYYSYKWAEVLDADAFQLFKEKGLFNKEVANSFKNHILSKGGTDHPMTLYKKFRGREPDINALLERDGLI